MSDVIIAGTAANATPLPVALTIDATADYIAVYTNSAKATQSINRNTFLGLSSQPLGLTDSQSPTNKTFDNTNALTILSGNLIVQDSSDATKQAKFVLSGITTGTTRSYTLPNASVTLASLSGTETFTNKTLTSPTINSPTITNATITADTVSGYTTSNSGTVYGMSVTTGVLASAAIAGAVNTAAVQNNAITAPLLATNAITLGYAQITSDYTTTTTPGYQDTTLSVTFTVPSGGRDVKVTVFSSFVGTSATAGTALTVAVRESSSVLGQVVWNQPASSYNIPLSFVTHVSAPSAGSHTYKVSVAQSAAGTMTVKGGSSGSTVTPSPAFILVEAI